MSFLIHKYIDMKKEEIIEMAEKYSSRTISQVDYMAGFQAACNIVRQKLETCHNEDFCNEMEELAQVAYIDLSFDD
jgi:hypothetical protein